MRGKIAVALFTDNDFGKVTGVTTALSAVLAYAPPDIQPRVFTAADIDCDQPGYLALQSIGLGIPFYREMKMYVPRWRHYLQHAQRHRTAVVHLTTPGPLGLTALWIARHMRLPIIGSFHTDLAAYSRILSGSTQLGYWMEQYMRWMYGQCERVLVPSESSRELLPWAKTLPNRIEVWPRGVDTTLFSPGKRSEALRRHWGVSEYRPAVLYVGRLSREKGLGLLPALQAALQARGFDHRLILAGDGPFRGELAARCTDAVFTGVLGRHAVAEVFASADVFVFPSRTDTAGNVVLEAQASGLPVLVSGAGGPHENMLPGRSGIICESDAPTEWAEALVRMLASTKTRQALGRAARDYALSKRWQVALEPLYRSYRELASFGRDIERRNGAA
jgi:glycosyltransferase involved in cell wall biosynthesis